MAINNKDYKAYGPFKLWTIENFPFIEEDFDAITNYQLWCKIVENMKKLIENQTTLENSQKEVIDAFNELEKYVNDYFENLDIQTEIDNKLDEMAESGQLTDIIAQYLDLAGVLAFNTISDLHNATNLSNGSIAYTLGQTTYNDGKGAFYKIRNVTSEDVVDGFNIVSISSDNTIIGERLPNYYINEINNEIDEINEKIDSLDYGKVLIIGDSFIAQYPNNNWGLKLVNLMGLTSSDYTIIGEGGAGVYNVGNQNTNFLGLLQANINTITDKNLYKKIIIGGGYNDGNATSIADILTPLESLINYCKEQFPNAKIYFSCFGWNMNYANILFRDRINGIVIPAYKQASKFGGYYLANTEFCYRDVNLYDGSNPAVDDMVHPNDDGQREIAQAIYEGLVTCYTPRYKSSLIAFDSTTTSDLSSASCYFFHTLTPFNHQINMNGNFIVSKTYSAVTGTSIDLGLMPDPYLRRCNDNFLYFTKMKGRFYATNSKNYECDFPLSYNNAGHIILSIPPGVAQENLDITSLVVVDTSIFDRYTW